MLILVLKLVLVFIMTSIPFVLALKKSDSKEKSNAWDNVYSLCGFLLTKINMWRAEHKQKDPLRIIKCFLIIKFRKLNRHARNSLSNIFVKK